MLREAFVQCRGESPPHCATTGAAARTRRTTLAACREDTIVSTVGRHQSLLTVVKSIVNSEWKWKALCAFCGTVVGSKEMEEQMRGRCALSSDLSKEDRAQTANTCPPHAFMMRTFEHRMREHSMLERKDLSSTEWPRGYMTRIVLLHIICRGRGETPSVQPFPCLGGEYLCRFTDIK